MKIHNLFKFSLWMFFSQLIVRNKRWLRVKPISLPGNWQYSYRTNLQLQRNNTFKALVNYQVGNLIEKERDLINSALFKGKIIILSLIILLIHQLGKRWRKRLAVSIY